MQGGILHGAMFISLVPTTWVGAEEMPIELRSIGPLGFARGRLAGVPVLTRAFLYTSSYGNSRVTNLAGFVLVLVMVWE